MSVYWKILVAFSSKSTKCADPQQFCRTKKLHRTHPCRKWYPGSDFSNIVQEPPISKMGHKWTHLNKVIPFPYIKHHPETMAYILGTIFLGGLILGGSDDCNSLSEPCRGRDGMLPDAQQKPPKNPVLVVESQAFDGYIVTPQVSHIHMFP